MSDKKELIKESIRIFFIVLFGIFIAHWFSGITGLEMWSVNHGWYGWTLLFLFYFVFVFIAELIYGFIIFRLWRKRKR